MIRARQKADTVQGWGWKKAQRPKIIGSKKIIMFYKLQVQTRKTLYGEEKCSIWCYVEKHPS